MKLRILSLLLPLIGAALLPAGAFTEDFGRAPFSQDETAVGVNGWILRSASSELGNEAACIRSGGTTSGGQSLEVVARTEATFLRNIPNPPLAVSSSKNQSISVDLLYENPNDFKSGVVYLAVSTDAGALNIGLTSGEPGATGVAFVDLGGNSRRVASPVGTFKEATWYRFTVELYQGGAGHSARIVLAPLDSKGEPASKPAWETTVPMDGFSPKEINRFDLAVARTGKATATRVGRFGALKVSGSN